MAFPCYLQFLSENTNFLENPNGFFYKSLKLTYAYKLRATSRMAVQSIKPWLHERFFACDGDAIFWKIVASPAHGENRMCSHPHTGDATHEKIAEKIARNSMS